MFAYDPQLLALVQTEPKSISDVVQMLSRIDALCVDGDGLKWFNWLYSRVTQAVADRCAAPGGFADPVWMATLDANFARYYFRALKSWLSQQPTAGCWRVLFERRSDTRLARVQFALAGVNAHINHDLCAAIVDTPPAPVYDGTHYRDFTNLNSTLDAQLELAKRELHVYLLGEMLPEMSRIEDTLAAWNITAARESAWLNAQHLWYLRNLPALGGTFLDTIDGFTTVVGKGLLIPIV